MRFFWDFFRAYPLRSSLTIACLSLGLAAEAVGLSTLLTLLVVLVGSSGGERAEPSGLESVVRGVLDRVGIEVALNDLLVLFVVATAVQSALVLLAQQQVGFTVAQVATDLRLLMLRSLTAARWSYFTKQPVGTLASSISQEANRAAEAYLGFATILTLGSQALLYAGMAFFVSWQVAVAAAVAGAVAMVSVRHFVRVAKRIGRKRTKLMRSLLRHLADGLQAVKPLKAMARESLIGPIIEKDAKRLKKTMRQQIVAREAVKAVQAPLNALFAAVGIFIGVSFLGVALPELAVLAVLFTNTVAKLTKAQRQYQKMATDEHAVWALREQIEEAQRHREVVDATGQPSLRESIVLEGVSFGYGAGTVLDDASLEIPAGEVTAIVGPSGAGKTSVADLVCGLLRPERGVIRVDGVPLEALDQEAWRTGIGYVPQEVFLVHDTVRQNVTLGEDLSDEDVEGALRRAGAWDFVSGLAEGMDTVVGERGTQLSGGQRQRICIARALVHRPRLLILDEATTALDPETEERIWEAIRPRERDLTVLAISHQPRLMAVADRIYRIEGGKVHRVDSDETLAPAAARAPR